MADFYLVTHILVMLWIQKCVDAAGEDRMSIRANTTTVSPRQPYTITCQTVYNKLLLIKNNDDIVNEECEVKVNRKEYRCSRQKYKTGYIVKLTVLNGEENSTTVNWECRFEPTRGGRPVIRDVNITVRNPNRSTPTTTFTTGKRTSSPTRTQPSRRPTLTSSPSDQSPASPSDQSPSSNMNSSNMKQTVNINTLIIGIIVGVAVLTVFITIIVIVCVSRKRKQNQNKQEPSRRQQIPQPSRMADNNVYYTLDSPSPLKYDWTDHDEEDNITDRSEDVSENINPNFNPSNVYGVVMKKGSAADTKVVCSEEGAQSSNPNFDPDRVYGVVHKSSGSPKSVAENVYVNQ